ncbi:MAG: hypothetical protein L3J32_09220 [Rhizobiaceae bacterium]|nr:hypothetical protein [Rhizobiaceae bacterium]
MPIQNDDVLRNYIASQTGNGSHLRVWSLIVTIFGDAIAPRGGIFRLSALQKITKRIGIKDNALRTAMSRLASDGWLERQRIGRASYYGPSPKAATEIADASEVIYRFFPDKWNGNWHFALASNSEEFTAKTKILLHQNNFAFHGRKLAIAPDTYEKSEPFAIPGALHFKVSSSGEPGIESILDDLEFDEDCSGNYIKFLNSAIGLLPVVESIDQSQGLDAMVLRTLLVHNWRRIVLKDVHWPQILRNKQWPGFAAQSLMKNLYHKLLKPSENWLDDLDATPAGKLPSPEKELWKRFIS